uniref:Uncharacterized protein n=1 Tax=Kalanchoe fedtschenkoi TaxID=63787 RepID=A0A7N0VKH8_KALFE
MSGFKDRNSCRENVGHKGHSTDGLGVTCECLRYLSCASGLFPECLSYFHMLLVRSLGEHGNVLKPRIICKFLVLHQYII